MLQQSMCITIYGNTTSTVISYKIRGSVETENVNNFNARHAVKVK